ncbi:uncharacterized protein LOC110709052 [Chenopodium quinoa]|uniref:uncharacterized protein LOC110709052 n=1 Tax=Chenopodium quinoa TaxID=63459 RepID=UPI000B783F29|nr:uncharacterized protein LOC110709052 [Chenopodium quinoa]
MGSTDSTATSGKVFSPPSWRPNERKSKKENVARFRLYTIEMKMKMDRHLQLLEQGNSKVENNKERGETKNDEGDKKGKEGVGAEEKKEDGEEEDDSEEDKETDESTESDLNSDSETESKKEGVADLDEEMESSGGSYKEDDDDNIGADSSFGNNEEGNPKTREDSSMFLDKTEEDRENGEEDEIEEDLKSDEELESGSYGLLELGSGPDLGDYSDGDNGSSFDSYYEVMFNMNGSIHSSAMANNNVLLKWILCIEEEHQASAVKNAKYFVVWKVYHGRSLLLDLLMLTELLQRCSYPSFKYKFRAPYLREGSLIVPVSFASIYLQ